MIPLKEAAASLGVTPDNLRGAIKRGTLNATKMGRDWFVMPAEVERYRAEHRRAWVSGKVGALGATKRGTCEPPM